MRAATLQDRDRWCGLFERRAADLLPTDRMPVGPRDAEPGVQRFLRLAAYYEQAGVAVLRRKADQTDEPSAARCLAHHAAEEARQVQVLCELARVSIPETPPLLIRLPERLATKDRPLPEQTLGTLIVASFGVVLYQAIADELAAGRVAETLRSIADDKRVHLDFTRELLIELIDGLPQRRLRRLCRLRTLLVAAIVASHALMHGRILGPITGRGLSGPIRRRVLREIERSLSGVPALALPRSRE